MQLIDFRTLVRPDKPNTHLLAPDGLCEAAEPDRPSPVWSISAEDLYAQVKTAIGREKLWTLETQSDGALHLAFIARTGFFRFKDDVDVLVLPHGANARESQVAVYSRSRLGYSDLGANAKRVSKLIEMLPEPKNPA